MSTGTGNGEHPNVASWGIDLPADKRPGVPYEAKPHPLAGAHWIAPVRQVSTTPVLKSASIARLTPVYGTATPPHGLSGDLRRIAYEYPDHQARHWLLLLAADRVDVIESDLGGFIRRAWPLLMVGAAIGAGIGAARRPKRRLFGLL